ncbi:D-alanyl-D-alanine carboxypeptidase [Caprobacter fermentans]|uniref:D-alanyl-D-alanine carboxypeptidase n=2 Tax=Caproicibacter fermentans TaxID=2576756 RepID=A0A6N8I4Y6_9FIRM|nr:D-alanyl-D-alanine carboxypeptidase [Caproicibacter fermentans]
MEQMLKRREKIIKSRAQWRSQNQIKKIKIVMTVILTALLLSVAAGGLLAWSQMRDFFEQKAQNTSLQASGSASSDVDSLPVYDDSLNLMLVNLSHPLESGYKAELTDYDGYRVDQRILPALKKMMAQAESDGCPLTLSGGYVDSDEQNRLYEAETQRLMQKEHLSRVRAESQAQNTVGKGGCNENQTGLAATFSAEGKKGSDFAATKQYHWLSENSVYFGFILRYPGDKESLTGMGSQPDHYRYVGTENAVKMREYSMCLEEYVAYLAQQPQY